MRLGAHCTWVLAGPSAAVVVGGCCQERGWSRHPGCCQTLSGTPEQHTKVTDNRTNPNLIPTLFPWTISQRFIHNFVFISVQWYLQIIFLYQRFIQPLPTSMHLLPRGFLVNPPTFLMNLFPRSSFTISPTVILHGLTHTFPYLHSPWVHSQFLLL